jgi:hypothetical protein
LQGITRDMVGVQNTTGGRQSPSRTWGSKRASDQAFNQVLTLEAAKAAVGWPAKLWM